MPGYNYCSKVSCIPVIRRHLAEFLSLPMDSSTYVVMNLWTANTQVLTAILWLMFELIFSEDVNTMIIDADEIRVLASQSLTSLRTNKCRSTIAKRGVALIESLLEIDQSVKAGVRRQFSVREIMARVIQHDKSPTQYQCTSDSYGTPLIDLVSGDGFSWEDIVDLFVEID